MILGLELVMSRVGYNITYYIRVKIWKMRIFKNTYTLLISSDHMLDSFP